MTNHLHLIARAAEGKELQNIIRDFKKFTSTALVNLILTNPQESRREWLTKLFKKAAEGYTKPIQFKFWQNGYHPVELTKPQLIDQKLNYIHNNPVAEGWVNEPEDYPYSSAANYADHIGLLDIALI